MPTRAEMKAWRSLRRRKGRRETGRFLAEGRRLVGELLASRVPVAALLYDAAAAEEPWCLDLRAQAAALGARAEAVSGATIEALADAAAPQPVLAIGEIAPWRWRQVGAGGPLLLLDGVRDPGNVGALARSAVALGAAGVIGVGSCADPWGPKVLRASAGAVFRGPVFRTTVTDALARLAERGLPLWVAAVGAEPLVRTPAAPVALALGSEARGVSGALLDAAARVVSVPLAAGVESLNVAAAGAILLDRLRGDAPHG